MFVHTAMILQILKRCTSTFQSDEQLAKEKRKKKNTIDLHPGTKETWEYAIFPQAIK